MPEEPYKNREIDAHMSELKAMYREHAISDNENFTSIKEAIEGLTVEVKKTNGSVRNLQLWKAYITGGMTVLTLIVVPLLGWALYILANIQGQVHNAVDQALSAYEITK